MSQLIVAMYSIVTDMLTLSLTKCLFITQDDYVKGHTDGVWNGCKYFTSQPGKGCFVPIAHLRPNTRFDGGNNNTVIPPNCMLIV